MNKLNEIINKWRSKLFYSKLISKDNLCFDIGANIGKKSKIFLSLKAKVIAFEPQNSCLPYLEEIKNKNSNFDFFKLGVGSSNEEKILSIGSHIEISTFSDNFKNYFEDDKSYWNNTEKVNIRTLNSIIEEYQIPHFCKIDVEGYEIEILKNLSYKIPIIEFEFTGGFIDETMQIIEKLDTLGDCKFNYILNENSKFQLNEWLGKDNMIVIIKSLPVSRLHGNMFVKTV